MKDKGRYQASGSESEYQAGSNDLVLKNLKNIIDSDVMAELETVCFIDATSKIAHALTSKHKLTIQDICNYHYEWLHELYVWAGQYRQVNMSKGNFTFAAAHLIHKLMVDFDKNVLAKYTPCIFTTQNEIIEALAIVHTELVLIHPFREGNGRLARLVSTLMGLQAGYPALNFSVIDGDGKEDYFAAVRDGLDCDYGPMKAIFAKIISDSL